MMGESDKPQNIGGFVGELIASIIIGLVLTAFILLIVFLISLFLTWDAHFLLNKIEGDYRIRLLLVGVGIICCWWCYFKQTGYSEKDGS